MSAQVLEFKKRDKPKPEKASAARIDAIDILRGLCVIGMILVAYKGDWVHNFPVLNHADWHGLALADMIFPGFLFCVGAAMPFSFAGRAARQSKGALAGHVVIRVVALFALGLILNLLPHFDFAHVRVMGILQRIALCYGAVALFCLAAGRKSETDFTLKTGHVALVTLGVLVGYAAILLLWPVPGCGQGCFSSDMALPTAIDRAVLTVNHLWPYGLTGDKVTYDPEGLLSTLGAVANVLFGVMTALYIRQRGLKGGLPLLAFAGLALFVTGAGLDSHLPVIKKIWTPSFALLSGGFSLMLFSLLAFIVDVWGFKAWATPARVFGANATAAFVGISLMDTAAQLPLIAGASFHDTAAAWLGSVIPNAALASMTYSVGLLLVLLAVLWGLYSRKIFLKL